MGTHGRTQSTRQIAFMAASKKYDLMPQVYPLSDTSRKIRRVAKWLLITWIVLTVVGFLTWLLGAGLASVAQPTGFFQAFPLDALRSALAVLEAALRVFGSLALLFSVIAVVSYLVTVAVRRVKYWESEIFKCDRQSVSLRKAILHDLNVDDELAAVHESLKKKSGSRRSIFSVSNPQYTYKRDALLRIKKKLSVNVNCRLSPDGSTLLYEYRLRIPAKGKQSMLKELGTFTKQLDVVGTRALGGDIVFGTITTTSDRKNYEWVASTSVVDKYSLAASAYTPEASEEYSVYSAPLSVFTDRTAIRETKREEALAWAEQIKNNMNNFMATLSSNPNAERTSAAVQFKSVSVGASTVLFTYTLTESIDFGSLESKEKDIDKRFGTDGASIKFKGKDMQVILPLKQEMRPPADFASMVQEVWGKEDPRGKEAK